MTEQMAMTIVAALYGYAGVGLAFALPFVTRWVARLDANAAEGTWGFRLLIVPGVVAFWPLLLARLLAGSQAPPEEWTNHRRRA